MSLTLRSKFMFVYFVIMFFHHLLNIFIWVTLAFTSLLLCNFTKSIIFFIQENQTWKKTASACFRKSFGLHRVKFRLDKLLITKVPPVTYLLLLWVTGVRAFMAWQVSNSTWNKSCPVKPVTFANIQGKVLKCETSSYSCCFVFSFLLAVLTLQIWIGLLYGLAHCPNYYSFLSQD